MQGFINQIIIWFCKTNILIFKKHKAVVDFPQGIFCWYGQCKSLNTEDTKFLIQIPLKMVRTVPLISGEVDGLFQDCTGIVEISTGKYEIGASGLAGKGKTMVKLSLTSAEEVATAKIRI